MSDDDQVPHARKGKTCRYFKQDVSEVCHTCAHWVGLKWRNSDGSWDSRWHCADVAIALGQVDVVRATSSAERATTDMKNEVVKRAISPPAWAVKEIVRDSLESEAQQQLSLGMPAQRLINGPALPAE